MPFKAGACAFLLALLTGVAHTSALFTTHKETQLQTAVIYNFSTAKSSCVCRQRCFVEPKCSGCSYVASQPDGACYLATSADQSDLEPSSLAVSYIKTTNVKPTTEHLEISSTEDSTTLKLARTTASTTTTTLAQTTGVDTSAPTVSSTASNTESSLASTTESVFMATTKSSAAPWARTTTASSKKEEEEDDD